MNNIVEQIGPRLEKMAATLAEYKLADAEIVSWIMSDDHPPDGLRQAQERRAIAAGVLAYHAAELLDLWREVSR